MNLRSIRNKVADFIRGKARTLSSVDDSRGWHRLFTSGGDLNTGDWQKDIHINRDEILSYTTVFACITLIASDIAKIGLELMQETDGISREAVSPAFSPVLRKPNHFQTRQQFIETWLLSKLSTGNTYILKERDQRRIVVKLYVLDPSRVTPLVAQDGEVFYQLNEDDLSRLPVDMPAVPASEIIHDRMNCLFHPLVGLSPIFACGLAAMQGLKIQKNSATFFQNMSRPSGILTAPGEISDATALRIKTQWEENYGGDKVGKVAVLGDSLKYEGMAIKAVDAQMVEQLKMSAEQVCSAFHVPAYMVGVGPMPSYDNVQSLTQQYYSQCLQTLIEAPEALLDEGLGLIDAGFECEFCLDDLLRMDSRTLAQVEGEKVKNGISSPDEARRKFNMAPVPGGKSPYLQQQNFSLEALAKRDAMADPFATAKPPATPPPEDPAKAAQRDMELQMVKMKALFVGASNA